MADANPIQQYNYPPESITDFDRKGSPGRFFKSITCGVGVTVFTGSNFGVGAIIVTPGTTGTASFSQGGEIPLSALTASADRVFEFSVGSVTVETGVVYALVRNQLVR